MEIEREEGVRIAVRMIVRILILSIDKR